MGVRPAVRREVEKEGEVEPYRRLRSCTEQSRAPWGPARTPIHLRILRRLRAMLAAGRSHAEISKRLGLSLRTIGRVVARERGR